LVLAKVGISTASVVSSVCIVVANVGFTVASVVVNVCITMVLGAAGSP